MSILDAPVRTNLEDFQTRMSREGMPIWAAYIAPAAGAFTASQSLGGIGPSAGQAWWVDSVVGTCSDAIDLQLSIGSTGITPTGIVNPTYRFTTSPGVPFVVPINRIVQERFSIGAVNTAAAGTGTSTFRMGVQGHSLANDFAYEAPLAMMIVTDSIGNGTGVTYGEQMYHWQLRDWLWGRGKKYRMIQKGRGGWTSTHAETGRAMQMYNVGKADLILYNTGMNDTTSTNYSSTNLPAFIAWKQKRFPNSKLIVLGPSPRQDANEASVLVPIRSSAQSAVTAAADPNILYCSLGTAFTTSDDTYYYTADGTTAGNRIHPNTLGHTAMFNVLSAFMTANGLS